MSAPSRTEFADAADYARAMRRHCPASHTDIDAFVGLPGFDGAVLSATWGTRADREAELPAETRREAFRRWHCFVEKFRSRSFPSMSDEASTLLTEAQVSEALSAAEFARTREWLLDFSITLTFGKMGAITDALVETAWRRFRKCFAQNLRDAGLPTAFLGVVEDAPSAGLHAHVLLAAPVPMRRQIVGWCERFARREAQARGVAYDPTAFLCSRHRKRHDLLHYRLLHYSLKGADYGTEVQAANASPDGLAVRLGDLLANEFQDPGAVPFERLVIGSAIAAPARGAWRSKYELGARDVNELFDQSFVSWVRRRHRPALPPRRGDLGPLIALVEELFALLDGGELALGPLADVCVPNLEIVAHALERAGYDIGAYDVAPYGLAKRQSIETMVRSMRAAASAIDVHGTRLYTVACDDGGAVGTVELRALVRARECLAALGERAGVILPPAPWTLCFELRVLGI